MHISSSYSKILGETDFHTREFPQSGSKAKDGEKKKERKREERKLVITMVSYPLRTPPRVAHAKLPGPKYWGKQIFTHGGSKAKDGEKKRESW